MKKTDLIMKKLLSILAITILIGCERIETEPSNWVVIHDTGQIDTIFTDSIVRWDGNLFSPDRYNFFLDGNLVGEAQGIHLIVKKITTQ